MITKRPHAQAGPDDIDALRGAHEQEAIDSAPGHPRTDQRLKAFGEELENRAMVEPHPAIRSIAEGAQERPPFFLGQVGKSPDRINTGLRCIAILRVSAVTNGHGCHQKHGERERSCAFPSLRFRQWTCLVAVRPLTLQFQIDVG